MRLQAWSGNEVDSSEELTLLPLRALLGWEEAWASVGLERWDEWAPRDFEAGET